MVEINKIYLIIKAVNSQLLLNLNKLIYFEKFTSNNFNHITLFM